MWLADKFREISHRLSNGESEENFISLLLSFPENSLEFNNVKYTF